jgi:hypothetical protein
VNLYNDVQVGWDQTYYDYIIRNKATGAFVQNSTNLLQTPATLRSMLESVSDNGTESTTWAAELAACKNECAVKVLGKMADAKTNLAVAYAEAHKTSNLILDTAKRILEAGRALKKGNLKGVARHLNISPSRVHKTWLEYKYGWMPLLMDVHGAAEFLAQQAITRKPRFRVTAVTTRSREVSATVDEGAVGGVPPNWMSKRVLTREMSVKSTLWCELSSPHYSELQQLGLTNPALVAWELVPFSFVFDWFIQVGDYLTALSAFHGVTVLRGCTSTVQEDTMRKSWPAISRSDSTYTYFISTINRTFRKRTYKRELFSPHPSLLSIPKVNGFDFPKLVTSLALLRGSSRGVRI